jgi:hypothetical protein
MKYYVDFLNKYIKNNILKHVVAGLPFTALTAIFLSAGLSPFVGWFVGAIWEHNNPSPVGDSRKDVFFTGSSGLLWILISWI